MYPFYLFNCDVETSDEEIARRYDEGLHTYSPDHHPQQFIHWRKAYESIKTQTDRIRTRLFYFNESGETFPDQLAQWIHTQPRLPPDQKTFFSLLQACVLETPVPSTHPEDPNPSKR